ncbi:MAG: helix-turn-helix domain-containing protein [Gemmataceae bacterium]|nr:helix-turn-helix domain-containing protein [Gemmataceae bacterium]
MAKSQPTNQVRHHRQQRGWSQAELAELAGISRTAVSAIEMGRLVPSVAAALRLAAAFGCTVEDLFSPRPVEADETAWAWPPQASPTQFPQATPTRFWLAEVGGRVWRYPVEATAAGLLPHDGVVDGEVIRQHSDEHPSKTLVVACCDPAAGLLAREYSRRSGYRLIVLTRSSSAAMSLLQQGRVHAAGLHFATPAEPQENTRTVRKMLGIGFDLLRGARWQSGLCFRPARPILRIENLARQGLRWVGREDGSAARRCLEELFDGRLPTRRVARDHRGVALAVRDGWADAGVCHRLVSDEFGLSFLGVRWEFFDWCIPAAWRDDPRIVALIDTVRSSNYRQLLSDLPGYDVRETGDIQAIHAGS